MKNEAGVTLVEVLIAVTLLSLLSLGMMIAMRVGFTAFGKVNSKLMDNRRVAGAQRILYEELENLVPLVTPCGSGPKVAFFQGQPDVMRLVSTFSLQAGSRGRPQILELFVIPGAGGRGVRLVVNEIPYAGPVAAGQLCHGLAPNPLTGGVAPQFGPATAGPASFVLADKLDHCRFSYLSPPADPNKPEIWVSSWGAMGWPLAIRIEMTPLDPDPSRLQPIAVTAPVYIRRSPETVYADN